MTSSLMPLIAFVAVVAMIPLALWLMRRSGIGGAGSPGLLRNVGSLSLSPSQRVVVVELMQGANARWLDHAGCAGRSAGRNPEPAGPLGEPADQPLAPQHRRGPAVTASVTLRRGAIAASLALLALAVSGSAMAQASPAAPGLPLLVGQSAGGTSYSVPIQTLLFFTALSFLPAVLLLMTGFTRIVIVLSLVRQAMGTQSAPPNQVVVGLSLFLTFFVMSPTIDKVYAQAWAPYQANQIDFTEALKRGESPMREFMLKQTRQSDVELFAKLAKLDAGIKGEDVPLKVLLPAFVTSELKTAFQIGFLIFIPFLIIDMIVASVLMSLGMMMLSPVLVSLPFKLMLFVLADGWNLLLGSLAASFAQ